MQATKQRIIKISEKLFFENGIANVRLQQIADKANISVGHLAYHFKNKEAIVNAAYQQVFKALSEIFYGDVKTKDLTDFDELFEALFQLVNTYPFCFNNVWEISRHHPLIKNKWDDFLNKKLLRTQKRLAFHIKRGVLKKESYKGEYKLLAQQLILNFHFRIPQQILSGKSTSIKLFKDALWSLIYPYLTNKGLEEYHKLIVAGKKILSKRTVQKNNRK
ncbi:MAG TPA: TetR/AcrR family transcriptional regulator [Parafilimonas sp.]|nr:TetR/AcrR family transcriptional regulator [Parafilimonas sp.]